MTMARMIKLFKLPAEPVSPGLRPMERRDIPGVRLKACITGVVMILYQRLENRGVRSCY